MRWYFENIVSLKFIRSCLCYCLDRETWLATSSRLTGRQQKRPVSCMCSAVIVGWQADDSWHRRCCRMGTSDSDMQ